MRLQHDRVRVVLSEVQELLRLDLLPDGLLEVLVADEPVLVSVEITVHLFKGLFIKVEPPVFKKHSELVLLDVAGLLSVDFGKRSLDRLPLLGDLLNDQPDQRLLVHLVFGRVS